MKRYLSVALMALFLAGCAHTSTLSWEPPVPGQKSSEGNPVVWNMSAENNGMFLFYYFPIWSGHPTSPNRFDYKLCQNKLTRANMRRLLECKLEPLKADRVEDVKITESSSGMAGLWIIWKRSVRGEGVAVKVKKP